MDVSPEQVQYGCAALVGVAGIFGVRDEIPPMLPFYMGAGASYVTSWAWHMMSVRDRKMDIGDLGQIVADAVSPAGTLFVLHQTF